MDIFRISVHGNDNDLALRYQCPQLPRGVDTIQQRHGDVEQDSVRLEPDGGLQQLSTVLDGADDLKVAFQQRTNAFKKENVIVTQKQT